MSKKIDEGKVIQAQNLLEKYNSTRHILDHSLESAQIMKYLAKKFGEDENLWYISGLLHDLDMDTLKGNYKTHGETTIEILKKEGFDVEEIFEPILAHTEMLDELDKKYFRKTKFDYALTASEQITGLITAYARMRPEKFDGMKVKSLNKKFKDKTFAANVNRDMINDIEKTGLEKNEFLQIAIDAITSIQDKINI